MMFIDSMICIFDLNERNLNSLKKKYKYEPDIQGTKLSKKKTAKTKRNASNLECTPRNRNAIINIASGIKKIDPSRILKQCWTE